VNIWLVIPSANRSDYLEEIIKNSLLPMNQIVLVRTTPGINFEGVHNVFIRSKKINIQKWWNIGISFAEKHGAEIVAVLNDDVWIAPGSLQTMAFEAIDQNVPLVFPYPYTGKLAGYCWILNLKFDIRPDNRFRWWYGDNDLQMQAQAHSKYIYVSAEVNHLEGGKFTAENDYLNQIALKDHLNFIYKWGTRKQKKEVTCLKYKLLLNKIKKILLKIFPADRKECTARDSNPGPAD